MTREEFIETIEGFEKSPFIITSNGICSSPLQFIKCFSDSVKVLSNGKPATYQYAAIESMTFDVEESLLSFESKSKVNSESVSGKSINPSDTMTTPNDTDSSMSLSKLLPALEDAKRIIWLRDFSFIDRSSQLKNAIHNTLLEKEWSRVQNMIKDAQKNHVLSEKIEKIIRKLELLPQELDCVEYHMMLGEVFALDNDYDNASFHLEIAGDYQNAAYYASQCKSDKEKYLLEIFRKWIVSGTDCGKDVFASFMALCHSMHYGRICAETIKLIDYNNLSEEDKEIVYLGLLFVLSNYVSNESEWISLKPNHTDINIKDLLDLLLKQSISEHYDIEDVIALKHANELVVDRKADLTTWEENVHTGYIIKAWTTHGYIGKEKNSSTGVKFNSNNITSEELANLISATPKAVLGLKVVYKLNPGQESYNDIADNVEPAENIEEYLQKKGINIAIKTCKNRSEEKLTLNPDGKTYSGYINSLKANFGFIHKEYGTSQRGVYFHFSDLEEQLKPISDKIMGLKVNCELTEGLNDNVDKRAVKIQAAESIGSYLTTQTIDVSLRKPEDKEIDDEILDILRYKSPSAALQEFATTNRPFHALELLERERDSFPYDKYVKHKIQLLQRTRSSDNELISLLNYAISTSSDGAYIAHNLYFLGQVQYRCKQYSDVVVTMNRLFKYKSYMKSSTQKTDSIFLIAVAYYMLRDYTKADLHANDLLKSGIHVEEVTKILNRTFATEESIQDNVEDRESELSFQFDTEVAITPYIEKLINSFSFGSISVREVPSDFDPWSSECSVNIANNYIQSLIQYDKRSDLKNNPNAAIAIAKIQKWLIQQVTEEEKVKIEISLRDNVSRALQIMSRNTIQQSGVDIRVNLFYRMQQYKMSVLDRKQDLFNAYINSHFGSMESMKKMMKSLKPSVKSDLKGTNHLLMISDILFLLSDMEINELEDEKEQIKKLCEILESRHDAGDFTDALQKILRMLNVNFNENEKMYTLLSSGSKEFQIWLNRNKSDIRSKAESKHWDELLQALDSFDKFILSENECNYFDKVLEVVRYLVDTDSNTQTAMKQNLLNQSKNKLNDLEEQLQKEPTFILYSIFADVLSIMNSFVLSMLAEVMSHVPNVEPVGSLQVNLGLMDSKEFILPLEFHNHAPSVQARNLTLIIDTITNGVTYTSQIPMAQNVDEGKKYSQSLTFRLDNPSISQVDICVKIEYDYDVFTNYINESKSCTKCFNYTITFREVEKIPNKYRQYAQQQTVRDKNMFFGRDSLIQKLFDAISIKNDDGNNVLKGGNGIVLYGQRRSGKTSILYHLEKKIIRDMQHTIVVNLGSSARSISNSGDADRMSEEELQALNVNMTLQSLYYLIILGVKNFIREHESESILELANKIKQYEEKNQEAFFPSSNDFVNSQNHQLIFNAFLDRFKTVAKVDDICNGFRIVIIIDEFTYFNAAIKNKKLPSNFMEIWKGIVSDSFITLVVAGQDNMVEFIDSYVNEFSSFQREWVTFLEKDASYKMVTEPIGEERIDPESAEKLYRFTAGSPFLLMDICAKLVDWMNNNKIYKLAGSLLDDFLAEKYMQNYEFKQELLEPQYVDAGKLEWTEKIKLVLGLIARHNSKKVTSNVIPWNEFDEYATISNDILKDRNIPSEEMREILERLVKRQVIETQEGFQNKFRIKIPLCREWILRRGGAEYGNE